MLPFLSQNPDVKQALMACSFGLVLGVLLTGISLFGDDSAALGPIGIVLGALIASLRPGDQPVELANIAILAVAAGISGVTTALTTGVALTPVIGGMLGIAATYALRPFEPSTGKDSHESYLITGVIAPMATLSLLAAWSKLVKPAWIRSAVLTLTTVGVSWWCLSFAVASHELRIVAAIAIGVVGVLSILMEDQRLEHPILPWIFATAMILIATIGYSFSQENGYVLGAFIAAGFALSTRHKILQIAALPGVAVAILKAFQQESSSARVLSDLAQHQNTLGFLLGAVAIGLSTTALNTKSDRTWKLGLISLCGVLLVPLCFACIPVLASMRAFGGAFLALGLVPIVLVSNSNLDLRNLACALIGLLTLPVAAKHLEFLTDVLRSQKMTTLVTLVVGATILLLTIYFLSDRSAKSAKTSPEPIAQP